MRSPTPTPLYSRNIIKGLILICLSNLFFWMAPWLLYFLEYIDFSQVATLMVISLFVRVVMEVPSGAFSDLLGKKKTLTLGFLLLAIGEGMVGLFPIFEILIIAHIILNFGYSLLSGTMDAYMYDTLISEGNESHYPKILSRINAIKYGSVAFASVVGGFMPMIWIGLPYVTTGIMKFFGFIISLTLVEPSVDTDKFSIRNFISQSRKGVEHLFSTQLRATTILLLTFGVFIVFQFELMDDIAVVDFGYKAESIGILFALTTLAAIPTSFLYVKFQANFSSYTLIFFGVLTLVSLYIFTPWISVYVWTLLFFINVMYSTIYNSAISEVININTPSKIRATTISTYELLRTIPFVLLGTYFGGLIDGFGFKNVAFVFALLLLILTVPQFLFVKRKA